MSDRDAKTKELLREYTDIQAGLQEALIGTSAADRALLIALFSVLTDEQKSLVQERARSIVEEYELPTRADEEMLNRLKGIIG